MRVRKMDRYEGGTKAKSDKFYAVFADHNGVIRRLALFEDRKASDEAGRKIDKLVDLRAANDTIPEELTRFIETTTPFIRDKLGEYGIIGTTKLAASKQLTDHIEDWRAALVAKGTTEKQADLVQARATAVFLKCGVTFWSEITANCVLTNLAKMREGEDGISADSPRRSK